MLESCLFEQAPELKIGLSLLAAGFITSGALVLCWLTGSDPWGKLLPLASCFCTQTLTSLKLWQPTVLILLERCCARAALLLFTICCQAIYHFFINFSLHVCAVHMSRCNMFL